MSARPRPKPRPVAKSKAPSSSTTDRNVTPSTVQSSSPNAAQTSAPSAKIDDHDAIFLRNRGRTQQTWNKLRDLTKDTPSDKFGEDDALDWDEFGEPASSPRHRKKKQNKQNELPRWQSANMDSLLSSDDDEEDEFEVVDGTPYTSRNDMSPRKRKRERSRSKSITPPPQLPQHQLHNARILVRQALASAPRTPSPVHSIDDSTDTSDLNPELAKIAEEVRKKASTAKSVADQGGGPGVVTIKVRWQPHPLDKAGAKHIWGFKMNRHDTFQDLFETLADMATVLVDHLVVSHNGKRLFSSGTPHGLKIWAEGEFEACNQNTWDYIRAHRHQQPTQSPEGPPPTERHSDAESDAESTSGDTLKLVLRSAATEDITLTVRPTTTCEAIVKAFLKAAGIPHKYPNSKGKQTGQAMPQLIIDGDKMANDMEISEADLDDGDLVEVVGL